MHNMKTQDHTPDVPGYIHLETKRVALSLQQFHDLKADVTGFFYSREADAHGMEPWRTVDGLDARESGGGFDVWFASGHSIELEGGSTQVIYVPQRVLDSCAIA